MSAVDVAEHVTEAAEEAAQAADERKARFQRWTALLSGKIIRLSVTRVRHGG